eukprot:Skav226963  [mRNA]  locus=scaffold51:243434:244045:- [translate_table: standard]
MTAAAKHLGVSLPTISQSCRLGRAVGNYQLKFGPTLELELLSGEKWVQMKKPVTGNDVQGRQVSSCGRIKSSRGIITRGHCRRSGYFMAELLEQSCRYSVVVHRLVAYAFLGPPPSLQHTQVNHKDLNPGNNCVENLEYVTPSENVRHFHANKTSSQKLNGKQAHGRLQGSQDDVDQHPGEEWRRVDLDGLLKERAERLRRHK